MDDLTLYAPNKEETIKQIETVKRFSNDICMEFGLDKCAFLVLKKGRKIESENIEIEEDIIRELEQEHTYKYLGIEESEKIEHNLMKAKVKKEYRRRIKLILKSELNPRNKMQAIKTFAIPVLSYGFGAIDWMQGDLNNLDVMTRKMLHMQKMTYRNQCVARLHVARKKGGMGVPSVDAIYKSEIKGIGKYLKRKQDKFIRWVYEHESLKPSSTSIVKKMNDYLRDRNISEEEEEIRSNETLEKKIKNIKDLYKEKREEVNLE